MASDSKGGGGGTTNAFEWLAGGLFFGGDSNKKKIASIENSKNVQDLLNGIQQDLQVILKESSSQEATTAAVAPSAEAAQEESSSKPAAAAAPPAAGPTVQELLDTRLARLRFLLYEERRVTSGQDNRRHAPPPVATAVLQGLTSNSTMQELMPTLIENLSLLPFESRKVVAHVFNYLMVAGLDGSDAELYTQIMDTFCSYIEHYFDRFAMAIVRGLDTTQQGNTTDVALHMGSMYRSFLRHPSLYRGLVSTTERAQYYVFPFLDTYVHVPNFDVSSDALECLKLVLTAGGDTVPAASQAIMAEMAAEFLTRDYDPVWEERFNPKLLSDSASYMIRRVSLQILSTVLLTRSNYNVMVRYVASKRNLILIMKLIRDNSPHITLDAFHVFKVFVANPNKPPEIVQILKDNQVKLCAYLSNLHNEKAETDPQFRGERDLIVATIQNI
jgi:calcium binding protein 39